ncbi:MAG: glycosyltransferase family 4 protein, partial [Eudoraea sp.]|nr:glycosyltransferase family 4 protein [Eudoraea sp.]
HKSNADVIHAQSPYMTFLPWLLRKKYITTVHNVQLRPNFKYKNPTQLIAISNASKDYAIRYLGAEEESTSVVCHGVSNRFATPISEEEKRKLKKLNNFDEDDYLIGFVGRITQEKGLDVLIRAVTDYMPAELIEKIHLVFVGDYFRDSDRIWFESLKKASGISNRIHRIPFRDPKPFYDIFNIFVLPSSSEAFGLVCVEAMLSGCCTVRTDTNGSTDQIAHGEEGFIFPVGDSSTLANLLEWILVNPTKSGEIANKGMKKALKHFTIEKMTGKTLEVYQKIIPKSYVQQY